MYKSMGNAAKPMEAYKRKKIHPMKQTWCGCGGLRGGLRGVEGGCGEEEEKFRN